CACRSWRSPPMPAKTSARSAWPPAWTTTWPNPSAPTSCWRSWRATCPPKRRRRPHTIDGAGAPRGRFAPKSNVSRSTLPPLPAHHPAPQELGREAEPAGLIAQNDVVALELGQNGLDAEVLAGPLDLPELP